MCNRRERALNGESGASISNVRLVIMNPLWSNHCISLASLVTSAGAVLVEKQLTF